MGLRHNRSDEFLGAVDFRTHSWELGSLDVPEKSSLQKRMDICFQNLLSLAGTTPLGLLFSSVFAFGKPFPGRVRG